jgi:hypothetical protein
MLLTAGPAMTSAQTPPSGVAAITTAATDAELRPSGAIPDDMDLETVARQNPLGLLELASRRCAADVRDYSCSFTKQERVHGRLLAEAHFEVKYRHEPQSVLMIADKPSGAKRVVFVRDALVDRRGRQLMLVEPSGWQRLLVSTAKVPLDDPRVLASSQRTIDQFGFLATLENIVDICHQARADANLDLEYAGAGSIDGRATFVLVRNLPYTGPSGRYPNGRLVVHLDQEWLLPVAVRAYADRLERELIAHYLYSNVVLNPGLGDDAFKL